LVSNRITFVVDGFNLYHSVKDLRKATGNDYRWLNIASLCDSFLSAIGNRATRQDIFYFSALAYHRERWKPGGVARHKAVIAALESTGVLVELAKFKPKDIEYKCDNCGHLGLVRRHEEKETDVALAIKVMELAVHPDVDGVVLVSGDTDLLPAIRAAKRLDPKMPLYVLFPFRRHNGSIAREVTRTFTLTESHYAAHLFSDPVLTPTQTISCPSNWK